MMGRRRITDDDRIKFFTDTAGALGRIEQKVDGVAGYIKNVDDSHKQTRADLQTHMRDGNAHGRGARGDVWSGIGKVLTIAVGVGGLIVAVVKLAH